MKRKATKHLKELVEKALLIRGYRINRYEIVDLQDDFEDPRQFHYYGGFSVLAQLPSCSGRSWLFEINGEASPYSRAHLYSKKNDVPIADAVNHIFSMYHQVVQPKSIYEVHGDPVSGEATQQDLCLPAPYPWSRYGINEFKMYKKQLQKKHNIKGRRDSAVLEAHRISCLFNSIQTKGYIQDHTPDGGISAVALIHEDNSWRYLITAGNHRALVLGALGYEHIPVRIESVIYRRDVELWPNVRNGTYTVPYGLRMFDNFFNATGGPVLQAWVSTSYLDQKA